MFLKQSFADEIADSMEQNLVAPEIDKSMESDNKLLRALELLNEAADLFDDIGMLDEAEAVTELLESFDDNDVIEETIEEDDHLHADDNCAKCGDISMAKDRDQEKALNMLENFNSKAKDMDFEDELD